MLFYAGLLPSPSYISHTSTPTKQNSLNLRESHDPARLSAHPWLRYCLLLTSIRLVPIPVLVERGPAVRVYLLVRP